MTETFDGYDAWKTTPPEADDCARCETDGCDGEGFIPGEPRISENVCCTCPCHEDPEVLAQAEADFRYDQAREREFENRSERGAAAE